MGNREHTVERMRSRVAELTQGFDSYCDQFDRANIFTGPSLDFHLKTMARLRQNGSTINALQDKCFLESLYATLTSWGLHRMGRGRTRLVDFEEMVNSFRQLTRQIEELTLLRIWELTAQQVQNIANDIWTIISCLRVGIATTKIISGSKALHHLLPELVPPIDRKYSIRFFFHHTTFNRGEQVAFTEMYQQFHNIAISCRHQIEARLGRGMNTSHTKVIDNAIVGYGLRHLRRRDNII